jgi:hypothetical protein
MFSPSGVPWEVPYQLYGYRLLHCGNFKAISAINHVILSFAPTLVDQKFLVDQRGGEASLFSTVPIYPPRMPATSTVICEIGVRSETLMIYVLAPHSDCTSTIIASLSSPLWNIARDI